ncbi:MAG: M4 family metallopeptidase, partial [Ignavibacteriales bacterium]|nr:M4 family metallopeptidase [Ignavibacteriales bacterium]
RWIEFKQTASSAQNAPQSMPQSTKVIQTAAINFLMANKELLQVQNPESEFEFKELRRDDVGMTHVRFSQKCQGIDVWARDIVLHIDSHGMPTSLNGVFERTPKALDLVDRVGESQAIDKVRKSLEKSSIVESLSPSIATIHQYSGPAARTVIWYDNNHVPHLAWFVEIRPTLSQDWYYFVDAGSGEILNSYNNVCYDGATTGSGVDLNGVTRSFGTYLYNTDYFLADASQPMFNAAQSKIPDDMVGAIIGLDLKNQDLDSKSTIYFSSTKNNQWTDPAAVSAHYNAIVTYNYYRLAQNRNSIDDKGITIYSTIHVTEKGQPMENAFWSGKIMCYGDGAAYFKQLAGGLDVAAHEMTHGVTQYAAGLEYQNQSGALNESMSDVFGVLVDTLNWTLGEKIVKNTSAFPSGSLRDLSNPHNGASPGSAAWQPASMSEFVNGTDDNGGVHVNSGIPNKAFYLAAINIGRTKAGRIWYRALNFYLTRSSQFLDARIATEKGATDLFGAGSNEVLKVSAAWDAVGVNAGTPPPPPPTTTLVGASWILLENTDPADANTLYIVKPTIASNADVASLTRTPVKNKPAVSDASGVIIFVDAANNLRALIADPKNPQETVLDNSGVWNSVAIGPGLSAMALTSIFADTTIYYLDLVNHTSAAFKITTESFDAADAKTALYADALSFDPTGRLLLCDTYNEIKNASGSTLNFWNINILDIQRGIMGSVFPPLSSGINVGNPSFSKISPTRFTFDMIDSKKNQAFVYAADFNTGEAGIVAGPLTVVGYPTYAGDDKTIAYHTTQTVSGILHESIEQMPLKSNFLEGTGTSKQYVLDATYPNWFVVGSRVTAVSPAGESTPRQFELSQNYPNPFNPTTSIVYTVPVSGRVQLKIFDMLGREVSMPVDAFREPGKYSVSIDMSDAAARQSVTSGVYFYRLTASAMMQTKKMVLLR